MRTLKINGTDIATLGATLLTVDYGYSKVNTYKDWLKGAKNPLYFSQDTQYTTAEFKILVEANDRAALDLASSNLVALARKAKFQVSTDKFYVDGDLTDASDNPISSKAKEVTITIEGIKSQDDKLSFGVPIGETTKFTPIGNVEVPAKFRLLLNVGMPSCTLTVNGKSYVLDKTTERSYLTIDGINGKVEYGGINHIEDYQAWDFPTILCGQENTISMSAGGEVEITYTGRWM